MLALIKNNEFVSAHREGSRIDIEDASILGAQAGIVFGDYSLHTIKPADPVPEGEIIVSTAIELVGGEWSEVNEIIDTPLPTVKELQEYNSEQRWQAETGGTYLGGIQVATDDRSKLMLTGARVNADSDPAFVTRWKTPSGEFIDLNAAMIISISNAVLAFVDNCFKLESTIDGKIVSGEITSYSEIDDHWL